MSRLTNAVRKFRRAKLLDAGDVTRFYAPNRSVEGAVVQSGKTPSRALIERIKHFYKSTLSLKSADQEESVWSIIDQKREPVHDALLSNDDTAIDILSNPQDTFLFYGMDNVHFGVNPNHSYIATAEYDVLERLSEALGVRRAFYDECLIHGHKHNRFNVEEELDSICAHLKVNSLTIPNPFKNTQGLKTSRGILDYRSLQAMYQASRIMRLKPRRVVEIGGGLGRTAAFSHLMGAERYTIVDIPLTIVAQALFLGLTFGEEQIRLSGEIDGGQPIQLLLPHEFGETSYDVVFNADSMTEMRREDASSYAEIIKERGKPFLSINHEFNKFTVRDLFDTPFHRYPYWARKGYVEEIYSFGAP